jgi:hypothetical protein
VGLRTGIFMKFTLVFDASYPKTTGMKKCA